MCTHIHVGTHINTHMHAQTHQLFTIAKKWKCVVCLHHGVAWNCKIWWSTDMCYNIGEAQKVITKERSQTQRATSAGFYRQVSEWSSSRKGFLWGGGTKNVLEVGNSDGYVQTYKNHGMNTLKVNSMACELYLGLKIEFGKRYFTWIAFAAAARSWANGIRKPLPCAVISLSSHG